MSSGREYSEGRLKELVLYLACASETADPGFGMVKLNKLLYRADFEAFRRLGHSLTGETYQKQAYGPVARHLLIVLDDLAREGRIAGWAHVPAGPHIRKVPQVSERADDQPDITVFDASEREIIEATLAEFAAYGAKDVSEWAHHESVGWNEVEEGQPIPYHSAFFSMEPIPEEDVERARQLARERGWSTVP